MRSRSRLRFAGGLILLAAIQGCASSGTATTDDPTGNPTSSATSGQRAPAPGDQTPGVLPAAQDRARILSPAPILPPASPAAGAAVARSTGTVPPMAADARDVSRRIPFVPLLLVLPSGRRVAVDPAGTAGDGTLTVPVDPARVGWWTGGARPGDPFGGVVLAGHVDSRAYGVGALAELAQAHPGQQVSVSSASHTLTYRITALRAVPKVRLTSGTDVFSQSVAPRLVLITCGGEFDPVHHVYADNLVVLAEPA